ncbi:MAG TPA: hypothetical protein VEY68_04360 [Anoxybacillus sp.]|nr:hypothetical protein [Anoxybacillus sp.]
MNPREKVIHTLKKLSGEVGVDEVTLLNALKSLISNLISNKSIVVNLNKRLDFNKSWNSLLNGGAK